MILDLFTQGQWFVIWTVLTVIFWIVWEIVFLRVYGAWGERGSDLEPPPAIGGLVMAGLSFFVIAGILGAIHWLTWMWLYG